MSKLTTREEKLQAFAEFVLVEMEASTEWYVDLLNTIAHQAYEFGLAANDADGYFKVQR